MAKVFASFFTLFRPSPSTVPPSGQRARAPHTAPAQISTAAAPRAQILSPDAKSSEAPNPMRTLQTENDALREMCETLAEQVASSDAALLKAKTKYREVKKEKLALQETCRELIQLVENLQDEAKMDVDSSAPEDEETNTTAAVEPSFKQEPEPDSLPTSTVAIPTTKTAALEPSFKQDPESDSLPTLTCATPTTNLRTVPMKMATVFLTAKDLRTYVKKNSDTEPMSYPFLCLPTRTIEIGGGRFVIYGPTHRYDRSTGRWIEGGSDLEGLYGTFQELFVQWKKQQIGYRGTFECLPLQHSRKIKSSNVSQKVMRELAFGGSRPSNCRAIIQQRFPSGLIPAKYVDLNVLGPCPLRRVRCLSLNAPTNPTPGATTRITPDRPCLLDRAQWGVRRVSPSSCVRLTEYLPRNSASTNANNLNPAYSPATVIALKSTPLHWSYYGCECEHKRDEEYEWEQGVWTPLAPYRALPHLPASITATFPFLLRAHASHSSSPQSSLWCFDGDLFPNGRLSWPSPKEVVEVHIAMLS
ncbi:hypothetical protein DFH06DRAFT_1485542 [Mycena polygramma]|nr:hypothetical protein DFH06DRAFT_1485542 [Mycena polygramma]